MILQSSRSDPPLWVEKLGRKLERLVSHVPQVRLGVTTPLVLFHTNPDSWRLGSFQALPTHLLHQIFQIFICKTLQPCNHSLRSQLFATGEFMNVLCGSSLSVWLLNVRVNAPVAHSLKGNYKVAKNLHRLCLGRGVLPWHDLHLPGHQETSALCTTSISKACCGSNSEESVLFELLYMLLLLYLSFIIRIKLFSVTNHLSIGHALRPGKTCRRRKAHMAVPRYAHIRSSHCLVLSIMWESNKISKQDRRLR